jgi:hypothetical protein
MGIYEYDEPMEMPTPCQKCGRIFELNEGARSEKWFPNTVICVECGLEEDREIELDNIIEDANNLLNDALFDLEKRGWGFITKENQKIIMAIITKQLTSHET